MGSPRQTLDDQTMRAGLHSQYVRRYSKEENTLIIEELGLNNGSARADIALLNGHFHGLEIKSDCDRLSRLPQQISAYNSVFDFVTIVVTGRHVRAVRQLVPRWWGITLCSIDAQGQLRFRVIRRGSRNRDVDPRSVARLLWHREAANVLCSQGYEGKVLRSPRSVLHTLLAHALDTRDLKKEVCAHLRTRTNWRRRELRVRYDGSSPPLAKR
jgi:hypothetical protein